MASAGMLVLAAAEALAQEQVLQAERRIPATGTGSERRIVVGITDRKLALVEAGRAVKIYRVAVGASGSPTPTGRFRIVSRISNPTYYAPRVVIPAGKENPLGPRWIGLDRRGYGIHGTNQPGSVGHSASRGCMRMRNHDVVELFDQVRVGDIVELHGERDAEVVELFHLTPELPAESAPVILTALASR